MTRPDKGAIATFCVIAVGVIAACSPGSVAPTMGSVTPTNSDRHPSSVAPSLTYQDLCGRRGLDNGESSCIRGQQQLEALYRRQPTWPTLGNAGRCPIAQGGAVLNDQFVGIGLPAGDSPVKALVPAPLFLNAGTGTAEARILLSQRGQRFTFKTLWFARPGYHDAFLIRGKRIDGPGQVGFGESGSSNEIAVRGATYNGGNGYREVPGGTFVDHPGCYAWSIDGVGFSEIVIFEAVAPEATRTR